MSIFTVMERFDSESTLYYRFGVVFIFGLIPKDIPDRVKTHFARKRGLAEGGWFEARSSSLDCFEV